jgi:uncharacterized protein YndB with AHSA1/START domain
MTTGRISDTGSIRELPMDAGKLVVLAEFPGTPPVTLFEYWTKPDLLTQWWPQQASVDPGRGGAYEMSWPQMGWVLQGHFLEYEPGRRLAFTWQWAHEPDAQTRQVYVDFDPADDGNGTHLRVTHGTYMDTDQDRHEREEHLEGWTHFLTRLQVLLHEGGSDG